MYVLHLGALILLLLLEEKFTQPLKLYPLKFSDYAIDT